MGLADPATLTPTVQTLLFPCSGLDSSAFVFLPHRMLAVSGTV